MKTRFLLLVALALLTNVLYANNVRVNINSYDASTRTLNITLAWDNSWHDGSGQFRDGVWLFVKYKDVTSPGWQHAILQSPSVPNRVAIDTINDPGVRFDVMGRNPSVAPNPSGSRGYIIRRQAATVVSERSNPEYAGVYNVGMTINAVIVLPTGVVLANPEFRAYAMEIVNIPRGGFWAGDGSPSSTIKAIGSANSPRFISNESETTVLFGGSELVVPAAFPKGTNEFFVLKYEVSVDAYCEFLNTLTRDQQNSLIDISTTQLASIGVHPFSQAATYIKGNVSSFSDPISFGPDANGNELFYEINDGGNKAVSISLQSQALRYLDWAGMRPMTGFEFEKMARGPLVPTPEENVWGTSDANLVTMDIDVDGPGETSSQVVAGPTISARIRNGAFARPSGATRLNSGGSYYGVMELGNGCMELHAGFSNGALNTFTNMPGDGIWEATPPANSYFVKSGSRISAGFTASFEISPPVGFRGVIQ
jgi:hypothetical protein